MDEGKAFENDWKKSVPEDVFYLRLKDDTSGFAGVGNICDCILYKHPYMYALELKSHLGKSLPFGCISETQVKGVAEASTFNGIIAGVIFNFRDCLETYFVNGKIVSEYYYLGIRKSFPIQWCRDNGVLINSHMKITRSTYFIDEFMKEMEGKN